MTILKSASAPFCRATASLVALFCLVAFSVVAQAAEQIEDYESAITVRADGVVEIVETIAVNAEGRSIRRGICATRARIRCH